MTDLSNPDHQHEISMGISKAIDTYFVQEEANSEDPFRNHLGASVIGNQCARYLYYHFRWMYKEVHSARMLRLFAVGHGLEARVRKALRAIGFEFIDQVDETGKQLKFSAIGGHFGGSVDGVFKAPAWGYHEPTLLECKTSKTGAEFNNLETKGVKIQKPQHYTQCCTYGEAFKLNNVLYIAEDKNDSDWSVRPFALDHSVGKEANDKAKFVILSQTPPARISQKRNFYLCNMCTMQKLCFDNAKVEVNCRSCKASKPVDNAGWYCETWKAEIPKEAILHGCSSHVAREA